MKRALVIVGFLSLIVDQVIKIFFVAEFQALNNFGVAFGMGSNFTWKWLLVMLLIVVAFYFRKSFWGWLVVFGGASNLIDRFRLGYVVDYLNFFGWFKFNVADGLITLGVLGMLYNLLYGNKKDI